MNDKEVNINYFKLVVQKFIQERNWNEFQTPQNLIQALNIEVAELSEIFLFKDINKDMIFQDKEIYEKISDEVADVFIYLISLVNVLNIDLLSCFNCKMEKNRNKYPINEFCDGNYHKK